MRHTLCIPIGWDGIYAGQLGRYYHMRKPGEPIVINPTYTKTSKPITKPMVLTEDEYHFHLEVHKSKCKEDKCFGMGCILYADAVWPMSCVAIDWNTVLGRALVIACLRYAHPKG